jgi:hypothetical protein
MLAFIFLFTKVLMLVIAGVVYRREMTRERPH